MPLAKLQEIIVDCAKHLFKAGRNLAHAYSIDYPYRGPAFAFALDGNRLTFIDNTQAAVTLQDGLVVMENIDPGRFDLPERNKVKAAFLKFEHWQNRILENRRHPDPEHLEREIEIITGKLLPLAVKMLKSTAEAYSMPDPLSDRSQDYWTHPRCDITCRAGMLEAGDCVPAEIQLRVEQLNDLLREAERRIRRTKAVESHLDLSKPPEASRKIIRRLLQEIIVDCAGEMILAGQSKTPGVSSPELPTAVDPGACQPSETEDPKPDSDCRKKSGLPRKHRSTRDGVAAERGKAIQAYLDEVFEKTGKRITQTSMWKSVGYKDRTEFERWKRNDPRCTRTANERFTRLLKNKPHMK